MKKLSQAVITALTSSGMEPGVSLLWKQEVVGVNGPFKSTRDDGSSNEVITVRLENGMSITEFGGGKYFEAFRRIPVGAIISCTYTGLKDARTGKMVTPTGNEIPVAYNGSLDGVEIFAYEAGSASEVFKTLIEDANIQARTPIERQKKTGGESGISGVSSLEEHADAVSAVGDTSKL